MIDVLKVCAAGRTCPPMITAAGAPVSAQVPPAVVMSAAWPTSVDPSVAVNMSNTTVRDESGITATFAVGPLGRLAVTVVLAVSPLSAALHGTDRRP